jgi:hypothetical protein
VPSADPSETCTLAAEHAVVPAVLPGAEPAGDEAAGGTLAEPAGGVIAEDAPAEAVTVTVTVGAAALVAEALVLVVPAFPDEQPTSTAAATPVMARLAAIPAWFFRNVMFMMPFNWMPRFQVLGGPSEQESP